MALKKTKIDVKVATGYDTLYPETSTDQVLRGSDGKNLDQILIDATTTNKGLVQLTDGVASTSTTTAATPKGVKTAYDLAKTANDALPSKAPLASPALTGTPTAPTAATTTNTTQIATTAFVNSAIATKNAATATKLQTARTISLGGDVTGSASFDGSANITITAVIEDDSHNHVIDNVDGLQDALNLKAPLTSPSLTGTPTAPTPAAGAATTQVANVEFVKNSIASGTSATANKLTTARTIALGGDLSGSATFDGSTNITITATVADDSHDHVISNVDGLQDALDLKAPLASPSLSGVPTAPTPVAGTNTTQLATTAFVTTAVANKTTITGNAGSATKLATARTISLGGDLSGSASFDGTANITITAVVLDDSHDHVIGNVDGLQTALDLKAPLASPALTGTPTAPTASSTTNNTQVATTAFATTKANEALVSANSYTDSKVAALVDSSPAALDTLNELANALGDDPNFAATVSAQIGTKLDSSEVVTTATANKVLRLNSSSQLPASITGNAATATKLATSRTIALSGDVTGSATFDGSANISINATIADDSHDHAIGNVDGLQDALDTKFDKAGGDMSGDVNMGANKLSFGSKFAWQFNPISNSMDLVVS